MKHPENGCIEGECEWCQKLFTACKGINPKAVPLMLKALERVKKEIDQEASFSGSRLIINDALAKAKEGQ